MSKLSGTAKKIKDDYVKISERIFDDDLFYVQIVVGCQSFKLVADDLNKDDADIVAMSLSYALGEMVDELAQQVDELEDGRNG